VRALLDWLFLPRRALSAMERDLARVQWSQAEVLTRLKELKTMTVVVAEPGDRGAALVELWQLRDQFSVTDPDLAAQLHSIYNKLVVNKPEGPGTGN
jgi:hypothetical protein